MAFERISLNIIPDGEMPVFHASQFDAGRPIIIDLYNGDDAYTPAAGVTFELHCRKVDDNIVTLDTYEVDGNTITFASTEQLCACSGDNLCEVAIMRDDLLMGTLNFILHIERDPIAGGLTSETSIYNLTQQIDDIISGEGYVKDTDLNILQSDWNETDVSSPAYIKNKPGPALSDQADWTETDPLKQSYIKHKPDLKTVATTGSYNDLTDKPAIPAAQVQSDWNQTNTSAVDFIKNKPDLMVVKTATGNPCTFETDLADNLVSLTANIVATQSGSGTPYPAGGGKNKLNYDNWKQVSIIKGTAVWENNGVTLTATNMDCYTSFAPETFHDAEIPVSEGETVILSWEETTNKSGPVFIFPNGDTPGMVYVNNNAYKSVSYTVGAGVSFITFRFGVTNNGDTISYKNIQVNKGTQEGTWTPYSNIRPINGYSSANINANGITHTIAFGQTVYGGVLDVTRGKLRVTHANIASYNGESINEPWLSSMDVYTPGGTPTTGSQVVYPLTTSFDIDLTPVQISALVGTNNITSDLGGDVSVRYVSGELAGQIIDICKMVIAEQGE